MERTAVHYMEIRTQKGAARARTRGHTTLNASWSLANLHSTEIRIARALSVTHAHAKVKTQKKRENPIDNIDRVSRFLMPHTSTSVPQARLLRSGGNENRKQNKSGFMSNFLFFFLKYWITSINELITDNLKTQKKTEKKKEIPKRLHFRALCPHVPFLFLFLFSFFFSSF